MPSTDLDYKEQQALLKSTTEREPLQDLYDNQEARQLEIGIDFEATLQHQQILKLRKDWSNLFIGITLGIFFFEVVITVLVGAGILKYDDEWFLRIMISGGIAQLIAMPFLVTQFLFSKDSFVAGDK